MMMHDPYSSVAENYDVMIDWPARIVRERPFFERLFRERDVRRVLDVGCGSGHHARMFAEMGTEVVGIDPSLAMLARARSMTAGDNPHFVEGGFVDIPNLHANFDLIAVLGNTLAYAKDADDLIAILRRIRHALTPRGRVCIQVVNYDNVLQQESHWLPLINRQRDGREYLFLREYRRLSAQSVEFTIITLVKDEVWRRTTERSLHFAVTGEALTTALQHAGFSDFALYGGYDLALYEPALSPSLVALAENR